MCATTATPFTSSVSDAIWRYRLSRNDLVVVALSGVQRLITESRRTADLSGASEIVVTMARTAVQALKSEYGDRVELIFPSHEVTTESTDRGNKTHDGVPNKIVALLPEGEGPTAAAATAEHLRRWWAARIEDTFGHPMDPDPGWPAIQWVAVPASAGPYENQWGIALRDLGARKRIGDFEQELIEGKGSCVLSPRWSAVSQGPRRAGERDQDDLSVTSWVKRLWGGTQGRRPFPPTNAFSSATFRAEILTRMRKDATLVAHVEELYDNVTEIIQPDPEPVPRAKPPLEACVPGMPDGPDGHAAEWLRKGAGLWIYPETWNKFRLKRKYPKKSWDEDHSRANESEKSSDTIAPEYGVAAAMGVYCATAIRDLMSQSETFTPPPSEYLAILVQDLDSMGDFLSGLGQAQNGKRINVSPAGHQGVSEALRQVAAQQRALLESDCYRGRVVYAGGDDLLALLPARDAFNAARACRRAVVDHLPGASTALYFFPHDAPLQRALAQANAALDEAKSAGNGAKNQLAVGFQTGSGTSELCIASWDELIADGDFDLFKEDRLSKRLVWDLKRSQDELEDHGLDATVAQHELKRLIGRHLNLTFAPNEDKSAKTAAEAKRVYAFLQRFTHPERRVPVEAARVAEFLSREAR